MAYSWPEYFKDSLLTLKLENSFMKVFAWSVQIHENNKQIPTIFK